VSDHPPPIPIPWSRSLRGRFAIWLVLTSFASLFVFALIVFVVFIVDELSEPSTLTTSQIDWDAASDVGVAMAIALPFALVISGVGSVWLSRRTLAPITAVIDAARGMTSRDLERRLPIPAQRDELQALVLAQNALFARLEQGFASLSRFAANASHEVRTPLAVVTTELEVALRRPRTEPEWRRAAERSLEELHRLNRLVAALLDLARAESGRPTLSNGAPLCEIVRRLTAQCRPLAATRAIQLELVADAEDARVTVGDDALAIAFSNLLANAVRYTPHGGRVTVRVEADERRARVDVEDTGPGVRPDEAATILLPFARGHAGRDADRRDGEGARGLGLGLSIARQVVEQYGGELLVDTEREAGARFSLSLPLASS
jgi:signal transduction histidine kinase